MILDRRAYWKRKVEEMDTDYRGAERDRERGQIRRV